MHKLLALLLLAALPARADFALLMVEEDGCIYCARWHAEVGEAYPKTPEGKAAPLVQVERGSAAAAAYELTSPPRFTPTFILLDDKRELARMEGYPGEEFFWPLLNRMLKHNGVLEGAD